MLAGELPDQAKSCDCRLERRWQADQLDLPPVVAQQM
jgi:hypothetical protein